MYGLISLLLRYVHKVYLWDVLATKKGKIGLGKTVSLIDEIFFSLTSLNVVSSFPNPYPGLKVVISFPNPYIILSSLNVFNSFPNPYITLTTLNVYVNLLKDILIYRLTGKCNVNLLYLQTLLLIPEE